MHIEADNAAVASVLLTVAVSSHACDSPLARAALAVLNCEPGHIAPYLVRKASGTHVGRPSGGETDVRGWLCTGRTAEAGPFDRCPPGRQATSHAHVHGMRSPCLQTCTYLKGPKGKHTNHTDVLRGLLSDLCM